VFLNSLRQHAAREPIRSTKINAKISGLQLEGCVFSNSKLSECQEDSPSIASLPECNISWIPKVFYNYKKICFLNFKILKDAPMPYDVTKIISLPVYFNTNREKIITKLDVPCDGNQDKWLQMGVAIILKQI
jgi:dynein heavy chain 2